jgi:hypothetical protein
MKLSAKKEEIEGYLVNEEYRQILVYNEKSGGFRIFNWDLARDRVRKQANFQAKFDLAFLQELKIAAPEVAVGNWKQIYTFGGRERWERTDGAVVRWDDSSPYPNPIKPSTKMYTAWEPDPSQRALSYDHWHSRFRSPRRWKTAKAAMAAVDREYPL